MLAWLARTMQHRRAAAASATRGGIELKTTVLPFILRGVTPDRRRLGVLRRCRCGARSGSGSRRSQAAAPGGDRRARFRSRFAGGVRRLSEARIRGRVVVDWPPTEARREWTRMNRVRGQVPHQSSQPSDHGESGGAWHGEPTGLPPALDRGSRGVLGGAGGADRLAQALRAGARLQPAAVRALVRGRRDQPLPQRGRPPSRRRAATRRRWSTSPPRPGRSTTYTYSRAARRGEPLRRDAARRSAWARATACSSTCRWCRRRCSRCSPARASARSTRSCSAASRRTASPRASTTPGRSSWSPPMPACAAGKRRSPTSRWWTRRSGSRSIRRSSASWSTAGIDPSS